MEYGYDEGQSLEFQEDVMEAYREAGQELNLANVVWVGRLNWDARGMGYPASRAKHLASCREALGLKPKGLSDNLVVAGQFFRYSSGQRFTAIQCSDFALLARWQNGDDITPVLAQRNACGFNMLRVWTAFDILGIGVFTTIDYLRVHQFVAICAEYGLHVEFTAYTGINDPTHWYNLVSAALRCRIRPLLELVNELDQNTNEPDAQGRVFKLEDFPHPAPVPLLSSHGSNGSQALAVRPAWSYETFHTNDAPEWQRKVGHNAMELAEGTEDFGGSQVPILSNENTRYPDKATSPEYAYDAAAGAALLCSGSCYHSVNGKASHLWTPYEEMIARTWAMGARSINLEAQGGGYRHAAELETPGILRAYQRVLPSGQAFTVLIRA